MGYAMKGVDVKVLIAVASRHGSTREIALAIAEELRPAGADPDLRDAGSIESLDGYEAAIIGSAVYAGNWLPEARQFVEQHRARLATIPIWLFSSGPLGADPWPPGDPPGADEVIRAIGARGHAVFAGKLDSRALGFIERLVARAVRAPEGDFRDWDAIYAWAHEIGAALVNQPAAAGYPPRGCPTSAAPISSGWRTRAR
jgi:menaquinone-dependent protoporphyrinogen oxidase